MSSYRQHMTLTFDLLTSVSIHAQWLPCLPSLVLIQPARQIWPLWLTINANIELNWIDSLSRFPFRVWTHTQTHRQTHSHIMQLITVLTAWLPLVWVIMWHLKVKHAVAILFPQGTQWQSHSISYLLIMYIHVHVCACVCTTLHLYTHTFLTFYIRKYLSQLHLLLQSVPKKDPLPYFDNNLGKYGPILTIFSLLQQGIYDALKLSYFSHLTFIMLPLYLAKQTLMLVSMRIFLDHAAKQISMYSNG